MNPIRHFVIISSSLLLTAVPSTSQEISALQGTSHNSSFVETNVIVEGVVTAVLSKGYFLQGAADGNGVSSDGIFVFTSGTPNVNVGNQLRVEGNLVEFTREKQLPLTQIADSTFTILADDVPLPQPIKIGVDALHPPTEIIDDDMFAQFDPENDGIDFYETLEGMRVTIEDVVALSTMNRFEEVWTVPSEGAGSTNFVDGKVLVLTENDKNPERILIDFELVDKPNEIEAGVLLGDITGVLSYDFGNYRVFATEVDTDDVAQNSALLNVPKMIAPDENATTVAVYNVENLDPKIESLPNPRNIDDDIGAGKFDAIAEQIVDIMKSPAIVALQEVQDNDGAEDTSVTSASETLSILTAAIKANGGPSYQYLDLPPNDDQDGGQPGGNIRNAFLYDPSRANLVENSARRILDPADPSGGAFFESRKPVLARFETALGELTVVNVHLASRRGSDPAFGASQPPIIGDADVRIQQAKILGDVVSTIIEDDPNALVMVLGDFNAVYFEPELKQLEDEYNLFNLWNTLTPLERRSYVFEGQAQTYDHIFVSPSLKQVTSLVAANINAGKLNQASDHDPLIAITAK